MSVPSNPDASIFTMSNTTGRGGTAKRNKRTGTMMEFLPKLGFEYSFVNPDEGQRRILVIEESRAIMHLLTYHYKDAGQKLTKGKTDQHLSEIFISATKNIDFLQSMETDAYMAACLAGVDWATPDKGVENYNGPKNLAGDVAYRLMIKLIEGRDTYVEKVTMENFARDNHNIGHTAKAIDEFSAAITGKALIWQRPDLEAIFSGSAAKQVEDDYDESSSSDHSSSSGEWDDDRRVLMEAEQRLLYSMDYEVAWAMTKHSQWMKILCLDIIETEEYKTLINLRNDEIWAVENHPRLAEGNAFELLSSPEFSNLVRSYGGAPAYTQEEFEAEDAEVEREEAMEAEIEEVRKEMEDTRMDLD